MFSERSQVSWDDTDMSEAISLCAESSRTRETTTTNGVIPATVTMVTTQTQAIRGRMKDRIHSHEASGKAWRGAGAGDRNLM